MNSIAVLWSCFFLDLTPNSLRHKRNLFRHVGDGVGAGRSPSSQVNEYISHLFAQNVQVHYAPGAARRNLG
jgi:hypothetical protein